LVYRLDMSNEARRWWGARGVWFSLDIKSLEFVMLRALGRGARWFTFLVKSWASLYAPSQRNLR
jgi:hypothetical protein